MGFYSNLAFRIVTSSSSWSNFSLLRSGDILSLPMCLHGRYMVNFPLPYPIRLLLFTVAARHKFCNLPFVALTPVSLDRMPLGQGCMCDFSICFVLCR
jgi:hypothetical protein